MFFVSIDFITFLFLALLFNVNYNVVQGRGRIISREKDIELERQLKVHNKTPIKTVKTQSGLYDCIDIRRQPTLDHPLLKDHEIQMEPSSIPEGKRGQTSSSDKISMATLTRIDCPQGTVPIRRTQKEDLIRAKSFSKSYSANFRPTSTDVPGQHLVIYRSKHASEMHYGVKSLISVHNPSVELYQASMSEMWVQNGWGDQLNGLQAGWIVSPELNEDNHTRLFVLSTRDGYNTSCFTTLCNHFVQTSGTYPVDSELTQISIYEGDEYTLELSIYRDNVTSNWWLLAKGTEKIGYWPKELFPQLNDGALYVAWGGLVTSPPNHPSAPMGNGRRPVDPLSFKRAAYFRDLHVVDASSAYKDPDEKEFQVYTDDRSYCYGMVNAGYVQTMGHTILYGGPGGNDCGP